MDDEDAHWAQGTEANAQTTVTDSDFVWSLSAMLTGLNHLTLSVAELDGSLRFYTELLGAKPRARWATGAYLELGALWLCLSWHPERAAAPMPGDYSHYAFSVGAADFAPLRARLEAAEVFIWQDNHSEGESFYFLDPNGHRLEIHVGDLASRLAHCRASPYAGMQFFSEEAS
jgi:catechol 2,3-dioxygenase-like lactoylglutathione lyase family enzyme